MCTYVKPDNLIIYKQIIKRLYMGRFQAKGVHDHLRPEAKSTAEARRSLGTGRRVRGLTMLLSRETSLSAKVRFINGRSRSMYPFIFGRERIEKPRLLNSKSYAHYYKCSKDTYHLLVTIFTFLSGREKKKTM